MCGQYRLTWRHWRHTARQAARLAASGRAANTLCSMSAGMAAHGGGGGPPGASAISHVHEAAWARTDERSGGGQGWTVSGPGRRAVEVDLCVGVYAIAQRAQQALRSPGGNRLQHRRPDWCREPSIYIT